MSIGNDPEVEELKERVALAEAKIDMLEKNLADLLEDAGIEDVLSRADEWWYEHDERRAQLGRKTRLGRLRL